MEQSAIACETRDAGHGRADRGLRQARARTSGLDMLGVYDAVVGVVDDQLARAVAVRHRVGGTGRFVERCCTGAGAGCVR